MLLVLGGAAWFAAGVVGLFWVCGVHEACVSHAELLHAGKNKLLNKHIRVDWSSIPKDRALDLFSFHFLIT